MPALLARMTGLSVAYDFRSADVAAGGQGAPLVPVVHAAMAATLPKPLAVLNLGGVGNVTFIGRDGALVAFDTGPANGPLDDWARKSTGKDYDKDGLLALAGQADGAVLGRLMAHPYLAAPPPKSLDRLDFDRALRESGAGELSPQDGAATLATFCAVCVAAAARHFPEPPLQWLVGGGGRRNPAIMRALAGVLDQPVRPVEVAGWNGDALEAQAFGVLAARVTRGLPLTFPGTTGVAQPLTGGRVMGAPRLRPQASSNIPSTSTAASPGREGTPMVVRACRPASPKISTARSEAPFITTACWVNSAGAAMKPPSRTIRTTLSRSPAAAFELRHQVDEAEPRRRHALGQRHAGAELAGIGDLAVLQRDLAGDHHQLPGDVVGDVVRNRRRRRRQGDAQFLQPRLDPARHAASLL